jgi:hypothetical protein
MHHHVVGKPQASQNQQAGENERDRIDGMPI